MKHVASGTAGILIVLGILIAANVIVSRTAALRMDLTEEQLYTLSNGTRQMLKDLNRDVTLKFYFSKSGEATPVPIKQYGQRIRDLLREYETHSGGHVVLETYDPRPDSDEEEWAQKYGVAAQGLSMFGGDPVYLGIVAVSGAQEAVIPLVDPRSEPRLEYLVTRLIHEVTQTDRARIGIMSWLPVMGAPAMPFAQPQQGTSKWIVISELETTYEIVEVSPAEEEIPSDLAALIVIHPKNASEETMYLLDQYVLGGGRMLAFLDPLCAVDESAASRFQQFAPPQSASDLNRLTSAWGIEMHSGQVVGDLRAATQLGTGQGQVDRVITWLSLRGDQIDRDEVATSPLEFVMMPFAGALTGDAAEGLTMKTLLRTSDEAGLLSSFQAMGDSSSAIQSLDRHASMPLAVRLQGNFKTAFPGGRPKPESAEEKVSEAHLTESTEPGVVILVTDVDMLHDRNTVRTVSIFGQTLMEPFTDNLNLLLNLTEQLAGNEALIGLRSRGTFERPFSRVLALQKEAQEKYQTEEEGLQAKLQTAQARLDDLQQGKQQDQRFIMSPEQQAEIEKFNEEVVRTRRQLKEVRKNLRGDYERLGMNVKMINIAAVPLLVAVFGVVRGVRRRNSAGTKAGGL